MIELSEERIVVTGGSGFLGSFVCEEFLDQGAENVFVPRSEDYDLTEEADVKKLYESFKPTIIVHLAALVGGIGANVNQPARFLRDNLLMGSHIIEYASTYNLKKVTIIGTVCSYPEGIEVPFEEREIWEGYPNKINAPYGLAKRILLTHSKTYREQYNLNSIYLIPVNLYGPRENFDLATAHVIPSLIKKFHEAKINDEKTVTLWGSGNPTREFLHVIDAARAIVKATKIYSGNDPLNLGSGREISIKQLATLIQGCVGYSGEIVWDQNQPEGQLRRLVDSSKASEVLDWESRISLEKGLSGIIEWYHNNIEKVQKKPRASGFRREDSFPERIKTSSE